MRYFCSRFILNQILRIIGKCQLLRCASGSTFFLAEPIAQCHAPKRNFVQVQCWAGLIGDRDASNGNFDDGRHSRALM